MPSTTVAMMLASIVLSRVSLETLGPDLALGRPTTSRQSFGGDRGPHGSPMVVDGNVATYWRTRDAATGGTIEIELAAPRPIDHVDLREPEGAEGRVRRFSVQARTVDGWTTVAQGTNIGPRRVLRFPAVMANRMRVVIEDSVDAPHLAHIGVHSGPPNVEVVTDSPCFLDRTSVFLAADRDRAEIFYTLDGRKPDRKAIRYRGGAIEITDDTPLRTIAFEGDRRGLDESRVDFTRYDSDDAIVATFPIRWRPNKNGLRRVGIEPTSSAVVDRITIRPTDRVGTRRVTFEGLLRIPRDGVFELHFDSPGATLVRLDFEDGGGVWTSGPHATTMRRPFRTGWHRLRIEWEGDHASALEMEIEGTGMHRRAIRSADLGVETAS